MPAELALGADEQTKNQGDDDAEGEVDLAADRRVSAPAGASSRR